MSDGKTGAPPAASGTVRGIDAVIDMIGHHQIGNGLALVARQLGVGSDAFFKPSAERYWIDVPAHGVSVELSQLASDANESSKSGKTNNPRDRWALHSVKLYSKQQTASQQTARGVWTPAWPAGLDAETLTFAAAVQALGDDQSGLPSKADPRVSFFRAGLHGTASVIELTFTAKLRGITQLYATHLGSTAPWPIDAEKNNAYEKR